MSTLVSIVELDSTGSNLVLVCRFTNPNSKTSCVGARGRNKTNQAPETVRPSAAEGKKSRVSYSGLAAGSCPTSFSRGRAKQLRQLACLYGAPLPMRWTDTVLKLPLDQVQHGIAQAQWLQCHHRFQTRAFRRLLWSLLTGEAFVTTREAAAKSASGSTVMASIQLQLPI